MQTTLSKANLIAVSKYTALSAQNLNSKLARASKIHNPNTFQYCCHRKL